MEWKGLGRLRLCIFYGALLFSSQEEGITDGRKKEAYTDNEVLQLWVERGERRTELKKNTHSVD